MGKAVLSEWNFIGMLYMEINCYPHSHEIGTTLVLFFGEYVREFSYS